MKMVRVALWGAVIVAGMVLAGRFLSMNETSNPSGGPGGPFTLTAHTGESVSNTDFAGRYMLIYFGYSFCPDVCPLDLQKLSVALYTLEQEGYDTSPIQPLFITIDPERDTVEELSSFMADFHPGILALTGSMEQIAAVTKNYKVYYAKREQPGMEGYLMDHQAYIFAMGPEGNFLRLFSSIDKPEDIVAAFRPVLSKNQS